MVKRFCLDFNIVFYKTDLKTPFIYFFYCVLRSFSNVYVLKKSMMKFTDKNNILTYAGIQYCPVITLNEMSDAFSVKHVKWQLSIER